MHRSIVSTPIIKSIDRHIMPCAVKGSAADEDEAKTELAKANYQHDDQQ